MLKEDILQKAVDAVGWPPAIDPCCDPLGSNALAPLYYSAWQNSLLQHSSLLGADLIVNPPYSRIKEFLTLLNNLFEEDPETRAILIVPHRETKDKWFETLSTDKKFRLLQSWSSGSEMFTLPHKLLPLDLTKRYTKNATDERITVWEMSRHNSDAENFNW